MEAMAFACRLRLGGAMFSVDGRGLFAFPVLMLALMAGGALVARAGTRVIAWGAGTYVANPPDENDWGQSIVPANLTNVAEVAGGWQQSVALKSDGTLQGWGGDELGQIDFPPGTNYTAIACGDYQSLALKSDGTVVVVCSNAYDFYGQIDVPMGLSNVVAVACGYYHCLALKSDGTVAAWGGTGSVDYGQGTVPGGLSNVVAIAAGGYHNLALRSDGTVFGWGDNADGENNIPAGLSNVVAVAAGGGHNLALREDGTIVAWGLDSDGQTDVPANLSNAVAIAAGGAHSLALKGNGTVVAWGSNAYEQTNVPANLTNVIQIAAGDEHSLALVGNGPPVETVMVQPSFGTNGFSASFATQNGRTYRLEYKNALADDSWQSLPLHAGTGGVLQLTDPAIVLQRFYRVVRW
jgi:Regulator of chromosome condensation (RCC1) repeat